MTYLLSKADDDKHKYKIITPDDKVLLFGAAGYEDYTIHKDKARRKKYITRHTKNENWQDVNTRAMWSRYLLWEKPTIEQAIKYIQKKFKIKIKWNT